MIAPEAALATLHAAGVKRRSHKAGLAVLMREHGDQLDSTEARELLAELGYVDAPMPAPLPAPNARQRVERFGERWTSTRAPRTPEEREEQMWALVAEARLMHPGTDPLTAIINARCSPVYAAELAEALGDGNGL